MEEDEKYGTLMDTTHTKRYRKSWITDQGLWVEETLVTTVDGPEE